MRTTVAVVNGPGEEFVPTGRTAHVLAGRVVKPVLVW